MRRTAFTLISCNFLLYNNYILEQGNIIIRCMRTNNVIVYMTNDNNKRFYRIN